jgi:NAD(P)-dependent dehydrogenase (short-subunit alcohol dehydrogenase family)
VTGSAGGMGQALRARLEAAGHRVVGVDRHDAEVVADLRSAEGRDQMMAEVTAACGGVLDGLVAAAGIYRGAAADIVSVNYFGAVATLAGLRPLLATSPAARAVAVCSNSMTTQPGLRMEIVERCLEGDEEAARQAAGVDALSAYPASKLALARWVRAQAPTPPWVGAGIALNAVVPGFIDTPMTDGMWSFVASLGEAFPVPAGRPGTAEEAAGLIAYLLSPEAGFFVGSLLTMDGGSEAVLRARDWPVPLSPRPAP